MELINILEAISQELTQISSTVNLDIERVVSLPFAEHEHNFLLAYREDIYKNSYWITWTSQLGAWIGTDGDRVSILIQENVLSSDIKELMLGFASVITGVCLNLQGKVAIHANAILLDGTVCAFAGYTGMGKSTLTAYSARKGADFFNDDVLIVDDRGLVTPGNPRLKLYPHTGKSLGLNVLETNEYKNYYNMEQLGAKHHSAPAPLSIIYLLAEGGEDRIYSEPVSPSQGVFEILTHSYYASRLIEDNPGIFDRYINLVTKVPVRRLFYPRDYQLLPQVYDFLVQEIRQL